MRKVILIALLLVFGQLLRAQYTGFTAVADLSKFTAAFAGASQKVRTIKSNFVQEKVGSSRVDLQACKLEYSIVSPK